MCKLDHLELSGVAFVFKPLCFRRNEFIHGKIFIYPSTLLHRGKMDLSHYIDAMNFTPKSNMLTRDNQTATILTKPPSGNVKINWDATLSQQKDKIGMRAIIRNHEELVMGTMHILSSLLNVLVFFMLLNSA